MTAEKKLKLLKDGWTRQIAQAVGDIPRAEKVVALASLNGLFDVAKEMFLLEELAKDSRYSSELLGMRIRNSLAACGDVS